MLKTPLVVNLRLTPRAFITSYILVRILTLCKQNPENGLVLINLLDAVVGSGISGILRKIQMSPVCNAGMSLILCGVA